MKHKRRDLPYRLRVKRAQANLPLKQTSALLGGKPSIYTLHALETRKQQPTPAEEILLKAFLRMSPSAIGAKVRAMEVERWGNKP